MVEIFGADFFLQYIEEQIFKNVDPKDRPTSSQNDPKTMADREYLKGVLFCGIPT